MMTGPFRTKDFRKHGLERKQVAELLRCGELVRVCRSVYLPAQFAGDPAARARAVGLALPHGAAIARATAAWVHGVDVRGPREQLADVPLQCLVPQGTTPPRLPGVQSFAAWLPDEDVVDCFGIPVTSVERTAIDLARYPAPHMALAALDAMARDLGIRPELLAERVEAWRGERNVAKARRVIGLCDGRAESAGESWLRLRVADAGFPLPELQIWILDGDTGIYRLDLGWRDRRIGVEYDGMEFHSDEAARQHDERRRARLARQFGWHVIGVGRGEVPGRSLRLERGLDELLGMQPLIRQRTW